MYKIAKENYGYKLTFEGIILEEEMEKWLIESKNILADMSSPFCVFIDLRALRPLPAESQKYMKEGQKFFKEKGMKKSVVILDSAITKMQFQRIGKETGIYEWERYISAADTENWERIGLDWIENDIDPDK